MDACISAVSANAVGILMFALISANITIPVFVIVMAFCCFTVLIDDFRINKYLFSAVLALPVRFFQNCLRVLPGINAGPFHLLRLLDCFILAQVLV